MHMTRHLRCGQICSPLIHSCIPSAQTGIYETKKKIEKEQIHLFLSSLCKVLPSLLI